MPGQKFTDKDIDLIMEDKSATVLSGWTEANTSVRCDEKAYRARLAANHEGYMKKIREELDGVADPASAAGQA